MISKNLQILGLQPRISKAFLTLGQNNFGNKIPFFNAKSLYFKTIITNQFCWRAIQCNVLLQNYLAPYLEFFLGTIRTIFVGMKLQGHSLVGLFYSLRHICFTSIYRKNLIEVPCVKKFIKNSQKNCHLKNQMQCSLSKHLYLQLYFEPINTTTNEINVM